MADGATRILERLIEDDSVHEQIGAAAAQLGGAYRRARRLPRREAVQDQRLYDHVRKGAGALSDAARRLFGAPEPEPKRRGRRLAALGILVAVAWLARSMDRVQQRQQP